MRINRQELLHKLETVSPGLAKRENIEQSACFVFQNGKVITYNEEIACTNDIDLGFEGAVTAAPLLALLTKMKEDDIEIEATAAELLIKGKRKRAGVTLQAEITLPVDGIDQPSEWSRLPEDFSEAVDIVQQCATDTHANWHLTCVHIYPEWMEACDNYQLIRFPIKTGVTRPTLVKREAVRHIAGLGMVEIAATKTWLHFRNPAGLVFSCRRYIEALNDMTANLEVPGGARATLPGGLADAVDLAEVFTAENSDNNNVRIELRPGKMLINGIGSHGWYKEQKEVKYDGVPIQFLIAPKLLVEISKRTQECEINAERLKIDGGRFTYVTCLGAVEDAL
jgi:hypothetical protein